MRHQAIVNLYKNVVGINDSGAFDINEKLVAIDEQAVQAEVARLTALEPARIATENRRAAYISEADPLFFKWQAGEATQEEWAAKRQEIKERFPKE
jgi:hypothetical protein